MKKIFIICISLLFTACTLNADITPYGNSLPDARIGIFYTSEINITGGAVSTLDSNGRERFVGEIIPSDVGLSLKYCNDSPAHNCIKIQGIPVKSGIVTVRVYGGLFGTNIATGGEFDKTYSIRIK
ncbi:MULTISPECIES: hypothetical protein [Enterobacterales]|uniref:hypothetical protein n=1 Tax=Enterobacterales TaxID=91347 RepID=UPI000847F634|nr:MULTISPECIES: hypothetical protein [Enterobacterales]WOO50195.1 hypothetical protein R2S03_03105 [Hafnia alvei]MCT6516364.1 hypothetical protein [Proteus vulgaris]ODQ02649.1 hypothetical protein BGK50_09195 [Shigella sp. FC130]OEI90935.1 hypothetical protein BHE86_09715 [Shigella sp. FC1655]OEJ07232.1 hypothetical protein BHE89_17875 [Shigella sp. FC1967]